MIKTFFRLNQEFLSQNFEYFSIHQHSRFLKYTTRRCSLFNQALYSLTHYFVMRAKETEIKYLCHKIINSATIKKREAELLLNLKCSTILFPCAQIWE